MMSGNPEAVFIHAEMVEASCRETGNFVFAMEAGAHQMALLAGRLSETLDPKERQHIVELGAALLRGQRLLEGTDSDNPRG